MSGIDDFSWAVGLFEGEGCISRAEISIEMSDRDVIERFGVVFPGWRYGERQRQDLRKDGTLRKRTYRYRLTRRADVTTFLLAVLPFLSEKKKRDAVRSLAAVMGVT